jgi:hypothetical protein
MNFSALIQENAPFYESSDIFGLWFHSHRTKNGRFVLLSDGPECGFAFVEESVRDHE